MFLYQLTKELYTILINLKATDYEVSLYNTDINKRKELAIKAKKKKTAAAKSKKNSTGKRKKTMVKKP